MEFQIGIKVKFHSPYIAIMNGNIWSEGTIVDVTNKFIMVRSDLGGWLISFTYKDFLIDHPTIYLL